MIASHDEQTDEVFRSAAAQQSGSEANIQVRVVACALTRCGGTGYDVSAGAMGDTEVGAGTESIGKEKRPHTPRDYQL